MMMKLETPTTPAKISNEQAIQAASQTYDGLSKQVKNIHAEYHLLTHSGFKSAGLSQSAKQKNPQLNQGLQRTPVYIITFQGVAVEGLGGGTKNPNRPIMNEYNVVVDANTGEVLFSFGYTK